MMPTSRGRLLLDCLTVNGAMIDIGCRLLRQRPLQPEEFHHHVHPEQENPELLPLLLDSGIAESTRNGIRLSRAYRPDWSPRLNLLRLLHSKQDTNLVFRFVWDTLLDRPEWANRMVNRDDLWPVINQLYPEGAALPPLNSNRMASWLRLASWIGLVQPERSNTVTLIPTLGLLSELFAATLTPRREVPLGAWVADVESQFCRITRGLCEMHPGIASAMGILEETGQIHLSLYSDEQVLQVGDRRASHIQWKGGIPE
jgi:hypothetical protein